MKNYWLDQKNKTPFYIWLDHLNCWVPKETVAVFTPEEWDAWYAYSEAINWCERPNIWDWLIEYRKGQ